MPTSDRLALLAFGFAVLFAAMSGFLFRPNSWYASLARPWWLPPNWVFPIAWAILYSTIAISGWLAWQQVGFGVPLIAFAVQLVLNAAWSGIFFGIRRPDLAFVEIIPLWVAIAATIALFVPIHLGAALLLVPYLAWVSFAAVLTREMWRLNRHKN